MKRILPLLLVFLLVISCVSCSVGNIIDVSSSEEPEISFEVVSVIEASEEEKSVPEEPSSEESSEEPGISVKEDYSYYDLEHVVAYIATYKRLPSNYITKSDAQKLGWSGGSVEKYKKGAAIGGDYYGNYEKLLPTAKDIKYTECDLYTDGGKPRGEKRLIYSSDFRFYYTEDHYESFREVVFENGKVVFK